MTTTEQNFRPLIYLRKDPNQETVDAGYTRYLLYATVYLPTNYTVISSGFFEEGENTIYSIYVQEKSGEAAADFPEPEVNLETAADEHSSEMNWRSSEFVSQYSETGKVQAIVTDVTPGKDAPKGKSTIVLADADDTDVKPVT